MYLKVEMFVFQCLSLLGKILEVAFAMFQRTHQQISAHKHATILSICSLIYNSMGWLKIAVYVERMFMANWLWLQNIGPNVRGEDVAPICCKQISKTILTFLGPMNKCIQEYLSWKMLRASLFDVTKMCSEKDPLWPIYFGIRIQAQMSMASAGC